MTSEQQPQDERFAVTETAPGVYTLEIRDKEVLEALVWATKLNEEDRTPVNYLGSVLPDVVIDRIEKVGRDAAGKYNERARYGDMPIGTVGLPVDAPALVVSAYNTEMASINDHYQRALALIGERGV